MKKYFTELTNAGKLRRIKNLDLKSFSQQEIELINKAITIYENCMVYKMVNSAELVLNNLYNLPGFTNKLIY